MNKLLLLSCLWSCALFSDTMTVADAASLKGQKKVATRNLQPATPKGRNMKRECKERRGKDQLFGLSCALENKGDRIGFNVGADQGIDIGIEYKTYEKSLDGDTKTSTKFDVSYTQMVEYVPNPDDLEGGYKFNDEETPVEQTIELSTWAEYVDEGNNADPEKVTYLVRTADENTSFRFTVDTTVQPETGRSANTMKIDVDINNFPWKRSDTFLALISEVRSEKKVQTNYKKVNKGGKKGVVEGDVQGYAEEFAQGKKPRTDTVIDIDFGTSTADNFSPYGEYSIIPEATITVADTDTRNRLLQDTNNMTKESMDVSGDTSISKADFADFNTTAVVEKQIFVRATEFVSDETNADAGGKSTIAFSFINSNEATEIYWDPEVGVGYNSASPSSFLNAASGGDWVSTSVGVVKQQWWLGLTVLVSVVGNLLL